MTHVNELTHGNFCALHLSQMLSQLNPNQRTVPILSKQSALGIVMATGTLNTTLRRNDEFDVFLSRDGGLSWQETLKVRVLCETKT